MSDRRGRGRGKAQATGRGGGGGAGRGQERGGGQTRGQARGHGGEESQAGRANGRGRGGDFRGRGDDYIRGRGQGRGRGGFGRGGSGPAGIYLQNEPVPSPSVDVTQAEDAAVSSAKSMAKEMGKPSLTKQPLPLRPGYGTLGQEIVLRTNFFHLLPDPKQVLYRYHVAITPEEKSIRKRRRIFKILLDTHPFFANLPDAVATDYGATIINAIELALDPQDRMAVEVVYSEEDETEPREDAKKYRVAIEKTGVLEIAELLSYLSSTAPGAYYEGKEELIQALNIVLARTPTQNPSITQVGRNRYFPTGPSVEAHDLSGGLQALHGYYTSVRTSTLRILVNINVCAAAFYRPGPLLDLMTDFRAAPSGPPPFSMGSFLKGVRVETDYLKDSENRPLKKIRTICGLAHPPHAPSVGADANQVSFNSDFGRVTVTEFFQKRHNITLSAPTESIINVGTAEKPVYLPPEVCTVLPGQPCRRSLSPNQTSEMIMFAARRPAENAKLITNHGLEIVGFAGGTQSPLASFGVRINPTMLTVDGRILDPPPVQYASGDANPTSGSWNMINRKLSEGASIKDWSYLSIKEGQRSPIRGDIRALLKTFKETLERYGLSVDDPQPATGYSVGVSTRRQSIDAGLENVFEDIRKAGTRMLLVIVPRKDVYLYARIKFFGDIKFGIHTVVVVGPKLEREKGQDQYIANVALKFNLKRGGINQFIRPAEFGILSDGKTMMVGIDVTHPSPGSARGAPSIAGVVASVNENLAQWPASIRIQESRKEMVTALAEMIVERLRMWQRKNENALPERLLVYRDGVSEGQYATVLEQELPCFREAFDQVYPANLPKPKLSIIVVGKRHHTRFYPTKGQDADKSGNPKNGTVVDRGVTMERGWDFYLQAHTGLQGTARPAHYVVVHDEIGFGADVLEQLTHKLCYAFGRATKAVSICPPAYYADLLCERGRCYLHSTLNQDNTSDSSASFDPARAEWTSGVHEDLRESMFYI